MPGAFRRPCELERFGEVRRHGLLAVDVLAGGDRALQQPRPRLRRRRVEEHRVVGIGERGVEIGAEPRDAVRLRRARGSCRRCGR